MKALLLLSLLASTPVLAEGELRIGEAGQQLFQPCSGEMAGDEDEVLSHGGGSGVGASSLLSVHEEKTAADR